ncbi:hypothetical protein E4U21_007107 [Claviceps maximensis]|nr:hypothetical protein E4U21_007107 [Claviceps maximensis]
MNAPNNSSQRTSASSSTTASTRQSPDVFPPAQSCPTPLPLHAKSSSTDPFLKDANLLAEAAKRAQVAVMVRDFESCGISS